MISKDMSRNLLRIFGTKKIKIGHVGTLDPFAEGVLAILIGKATRLQDLLLDAPKTYEFTVQFGSETDTLDIDGQVVQQSTPVFSETELRDALLELKLKKTQTPPLYSAVKVKGKPLYAYARSQQQDAVDPSSIVRPIEIYSLELVEWAPADYIATVRVQCSKGTYVRCLARDLAYSLKTHATVTRLIRTHAAGFDIKQTVTLDSIEQHLAKDSTAWLVDADNIPLSLNKFKFTDATIETKARHGQVIHFSSATAQKTHWTHDQNVILEGISGHIFGLGKLRISGTEGLSVHMCRGLE
jgi:tRNA pseudouridine55 synthase